MGVCCSNNKKKIENQIKSQNNKITETVSANGQITKVQNNNTINDDNYSQLSDEAQQILNHYLNNEKNSFSKRNLGDSNQLKHSLEFPNTPYFKKNMAESQDEQFQLFKLSKQLEEITIQLPQKNEQNTRIDASIEQTLKGSLLLQAKFQYFSSQCPECNHEHKWYHDCHTEFTLIDNTTVLCLKCNFQTEIVNYEFTCQQNSSKFKFSIEQLQKLITTQK